MSERKGRKREREREVPWNQRGGRGYVISIRQSRSIEGDQLLQRQKERNQHRKIVKKIEINLNSKVF